MQWCNKDYNENIYSYANSVRTHDGGTHETGLRLGITKAVNDWATQNGVIKETQKLDGNDIREGLTAVIAVKVPEKILEYEGQTKGKLGTPSALSAVNDFTYQALVHYLAEHKEFAVDLIKKCQASKEAREAARKAKEDLVAFLNERWKGMAPIAWGDTLRESEYTSWIYEGVCGLSDERKKTTVK